MPNPTGPLALLAVLGTAAEVRAGVAERRAGRDPSCLTPDAEARTALAEVRVDLGDLLTRLLVHLAVADTEASHSAAGEAISESVEAARSFDVLMTLRRIERLLHRAHQHLLSRYAALDLTGRAGGEADALLEAARHLTRDAAALWQAADLAHARPFAERALDFARALPEA